MIIISIFSIGFFSTNPSLQSNKVFQCAVCDKKFTTKRRLRTHVETHSDVRSLYLCPYCNRNFTWRDNLMRHIKELHKYHDVSFKDIMQIPCLKTENETK